MLIESNDIEVVVVGNPSGIVVDFVRDVCFTQYKPDVLHLLWHHNEVWPAISVCPNF